MTYAAVEVDLKGGALSGVYGEVIAEGAGGDLAGDDVVQQDILQRLRVGHEGVDKGGVQGGEGLVGGGEHGEGTWRRDEFSVR